MSCLTVNNRDSGRAQFVINLESVGPSHDDDDVDADDDDADASGCACGARHHLIQSDSIKR